MIIVDIKELLLIYLVWKGSVVLFFKKRCLLKYLRVNLWVWNLSSGCFLLIGNLVCRGVLVGLIGFFFYLLDYSLILGVNNLALGVGGDVESYRWEESGYKLIIIEVVVGISGFIMLGLLFLCLNIF